MVVALRARHGQAQKAPRGRIHPVVLHLRAERVKAQPGYIFLLFRKLISRNLRLDESGCKACPH